MLLKHLETHFVNFVNDCASVFDFHLLEEFVNPGFDTTLSRYRWIKLIYTLLIPRCCVTVCAFTKMNFLIISTEIWQNTFWAFRNPSNWSFADTVMSFRKSQVVLLVRFFIINNTVSLALDAIWPKFKRSRPPVPFWLYLLRHFWNQLVVQFRNQLILVKLIGKYLFELWMITSIIGAYSEFNFIIVSNLLRYWEPTFRLAHGTYFIISDWPTNKLLLALLTVEHHFQGIRLQEVQKLLDITLFNFWLFCCFNSFIFLTRWGPELWIFSLA